jgi:DNA-binding response OmpR family regulator
MVTGESEKEQVIKAIQAGINDYLIKPFDAETLREKLGRFVGLTRPRTPPGAGLSPASAGIADVAPASAGDTAVAPLSPAGQA